MAVKLKRFEFTRADVLGLLGINERTYDRWNARGAFPRKRVAYHGSRQFRVYSLGTLQAMAARVFEQAEKSGRLLSMNDSRLWLLLLLAGKKEELHDRTEFLRQKADWEMHPRQQCAARALRFAVGSGHPYYRHITEILDLERTRGTVAEKRVKKGARLNARKK